MGTLCSQRDVILPYKWSANDPKDSICSDTLTAVAPPENERERIIGKHQPLIRRRWVAMLRILYISNYFCKKLKPTGTTLSYYSQKTVILLRIPECIRRRETSHLIEESYWRPRTSVTPGELPVPQQPWDTFLLFKLEQNSTAALVYGRIRSRVLHTQKSWCT